MTTNNRLLSLDILRGITIAGMILVNNPGSWNFVYAPLGHAEWNGLTPTDLIFPFFMFIMGVSMYISLKKLNFSHTNDTLYKILKRSIIIFIIGLGIAWFSLFCRTYQQTDNLPFIDRFLNSLLNFDKIRILGVLQRLALSYCFASLLVIFIRHKYIPYIVGSTLIVYFLILYFGDGFDKSENNIVSVIDRAILGVNHMYKDAGLAIDPEGILSTIPSVCQVLIGFYCGKIMLNSKDNYSRIVNLFIVGTLLTFTGFLLSYGCPINKKIWSPTFVLVSCGMASSFLALLIWIIDIHGYHKWTFYFKSFGVNPLFIFVMAGILSTILRVISFSSDSESINLHGFIYSDILQPIFGNYPGSLIFAISFMTLCWLIGYILYRRKIFIKV
ncbi:heparan-alpha-glucosaminide N-acetyltransferase domain-containing protein [Apibacter raozihei]|uniref:acyltransferase family protein n=1 Tax=Apibacter raozihei TaxID=2500547 RepID=UPI000FE40136|nr:heparan-alpha-glucosaminide N-acetyltransferase domain-containing protein [Apibacter raozihei]